MRKRRMCASQVGKEVARKRTEGRAKKVKGQQKGCREDKKRITEGKKQDGQVEEELLIVSKMSC